MKKAEFIRRYGEDGYQDMLRRRRMRERKPKKNYIPLRTSIYEMSLPDRDQFELREDLDKLAARVQKELIWAYKLNFKEMSIIIVEEGAMNMEKKMAKVKGEIYLRKDNEEIYQWFDAEFKEICKKQIEKLF